MDTRDPIRILELTLNGIVPLPIKKLMRRGIVPSALFDLYNRRLRETDQMTPLIATLYKDCLTQISQSKEDDPATLLALTNLHNYFVACSGNKVECVLCGTYCSHSTFDYVKAKAKVRDIIPTFIDCVNSDESLVNELCAVLYSQNFTTYKI